MHFGVVVAFQCPHPRKTMGEQEENVINVGRARRGRRNRSFVVETSVAMPLSIITVYQIGPISYYLLHYIIELKRS